LRLVNCSRPNNAATIKVWIGIVAMPIAPRAAVVYCRAALKA
jgi:hypothetical protein